MDKQELSPKEDHLKTRTIIIVEDDDDIGEVLVQVIQHETPHQAVRISNGFEALKVVRTVKPALLIVDYNLPLMNGITLYDTLHAVKALETIPTLMITAHASRIQQAVKERHLALLSKPFDLSVLLQEIDLLLTASQSSETTT